MRELNRFSLTPPPADAGDRKLKSQLIVDGIASHTFIPGYEIVRQFEVASGYLLATDYDCPYEEVTEFVLLDHQLKVIGNRSVGGMYSSHILKDIIWVDECHFSAFFAKDQDYREFQIRNWGIPYIFPRLAMSEARSK
jgi:hypothetical protein